MAGVATVKAKILAGQVVGLQEDVRRIVGAASSSGEGQQIIRICSRFVYENQNLREQQFCAVLEIISICCEHHRQHLMADPFFHLRSMHYIFLLGVRRKEFQRHLMGLASSTEPFIEVCDTSVEEAQNIIKQMHQMLWNASLTRSGPVEALTLQRFAFQCSLAIGNSLRQVCDHASRAHTVYENAEKSVKNSDQYFEAILKYLTQTLSKQSACKEDSVLAIVNLIMEYAKVAVETGKCSAFSRNNKQMVNILEGQCDAKMVIGLKAGLKLPEMAIGLRHGKCGEDMLKKLLGACGHVAALPGPNTVLILGLATSISLLQQHLRSNLKLSLYLVELLMKRCRTPMSEDTVKKVLCVLSQHLAGFYEMANGSQEPDALFTHVLAWGDATKTFALSHAIGKQDRLAALYNFGAHFGNLGSLAYRKGNYSTSAKFLELTVDYFDQYCLHAPEEEQKQSVFPNLTKRLRLWSDALRYGNRYWEAGVVAGRGFLRGCLSAEDLVIVWVKCKRDAEKTGNKTLRGKTVCDVVTEAQQKYQGSEGVVFDQAAALLLEMQYYRQQSYNTSEDQLLCGRVMADSRRGAEGSVWGLLAVAETLWTHPDLTTEEQEASCAVQQAKDVLQKAKASGTNDPVLLELEALAHFWDYLCYIQVMYTKADTEVKESKKRNPLTAQVKEPGEEEQVHDACDVRPTALLTLHTQHASLGPLQAALDTWDKFVMQDLPLKNATMTCASLTSVGYIYHLSGLVTPTIQAWGLLIALARKHSLQNYLIKGITELLLTAPELVDSGLVDELQQVVASAAASPQDTAQACRVLTASVATALYYYRIGKYDAGARLVEEALGSEVLNKRTIKTTEVQTLAHFVASLYAWVPPWLLHPPPALSAPCYSLALLACREANALVQTSLTDSNKDIICWRHRVASLLLTTTAWLGHLSITTAQPRIARAYLEKSLQFSQQLILPLRIAEFLELLARVDMLCDQLEDCRVKVDSLEALLKTHASPQEELENIVPEFTKLIITTKSTKSRSKKGPEIFCDPVLSNGERMRTESGVQDFSLKDIPAMLQVEAQEATSSPSMEYREKITVVRFMACPGGGVQCVLCATPAIHQLRISTAVLLALLHAHGERFQTAQRCLEQAQTMYTEAAEKAHEVAAHMTSLLKRDSKKRVTTPNMFVLSRLNLVRLQTLHARAECLGLEGKWEKALSANLESLQTLVSLDTQLLVQDMHFAALLTLQGQDLEKILTRRKTSQADVNQSEVMRQQQYKNETSNMTVTTPEMNTKKMDGSCKKTTQHLLNAPKHISKKQLIFSIFSDEEEDCSEETKPPRFATPQQKSVPLSPIKKFFKSERKKPPSSTRKRDKAENKVLDSLEADWGGGLPSLVLKVPSDLPLSPLNSIPHCPSQPEGAKLGCTTSPQSKTKTKSKAGPRTARAPKAAATRGRGSSTSLSQSSEDAKPQGDTAPLRGKARTTRAASTSATKAKAATELQTTKRTRASRSLRLI